MNISIVDYPLLDVYLRAGRGYDVLCNITFEGLNIGEVAQFSSLPVIQIRQVNKPDAGRFNFITIRDSYFWSLQSVKVEAVLLYVT